MNMRKGQAAMEYLMTYGWAILIVIVVVAALYAMGVFRIGAPAVPCSPCFSNFAYIDYADGTLKIRSGSREINYLNVSTDVGTSLTGSGWANDGPGAIINGTSTSVTPGTTLTLVGFTPGTPYIITLTYNDVDSGLTHTDTATLRA